MLCDFVNNCNFLKKTLITDINAPRSCNPDHILKPLHWLKVQEHIEYKVIFTRPLHIGLSCFNLLSVICAISSQSSLLDPLDHLHWSLFSNHQLTPVSRSQTAPSGMLHLTCGTSFLLLFVLPSSSPRSCPSSCSDHGPLVDLSRGIFHSRLKTFLFSKSFSPWPSMIYPFLRLIS